MTQSRGHPEADLQRSIVDALRQILPFGTIIHASNNEIRGSTDWAKRQQALNASMGQHKGFADLILMQEGRVLFLEVKTPAGRLSRDQEMFAAAMETQGHGFEVVRSIDDVLRALNEHNFKTKVIHG